MSSAPIARVVVRRRAVVAGRAVDASGKPFTDAARLSLRDASGESPRKWACHMRSDGSFFFLDVPPGRYALNRVGATGAIEHSSKVVVPRADPDASLPLVSVQLENAKPRKHSDPTQQKGNLT